mgnify:FL=1
MNFIKIALLLFTFGISINSYGQNEQSEITKIEAQIKKAAASGDYEKAALLTKQKNILIEIKKAVQAGDYQKASELKSQLPKDNSAEINKLKAEQKQAAAIGDYEKAAALGVQIENIKNWTNAPAQNNQLRTSNPAVQDDNSQRTRQKQEATSCLLYTSPSPRD